MAKNDAIKTQLRISPELHALLTNATQQSGRSMNAEIAARLDASFAPTESERLSKAIADLEHGMAVLKKSESHARLGRATAPYTLVQVIEGKISRESDVAVACLHRVKADMYKALSSAMAADGDVPFDYLTADIPSDEELDVWWEKVSEAVASEIRKQARVKTGAAKPKAPTRRKKA